MIAENRPTADQQSSGDGGDGAIGAFVLGTLALDLREDRLHPGIAT